MEISTVSIITPCLNRKQFVSEAVQSVIAQGIDDIEHIIIDGGSTDGTLEILKQYECLNVFSEPDNGIYDAINKGLRIAKGEIIGLLNTDDYYMPNVLRPILEIFKRTDADIVVGAARVFEIKNNIYSTIVEYPPIPWGDEDLRWDRLTGPIITNAWFFRRKIFSVLGPFLSDYKIVSDREMTWRIGLSGFKVEQLEKIVYCYRSHSNSLTMQKRDLTDSKYTAAQIKASQENLSISNKYLALKNIPASCRANVGRWYFEHTYVLALISLYHFYPLLFLRTLWQGITVDIKWPFRFLLRFINRLRFGRSPDLL